MSNMFFCKNDIIFSVVIEGELNWKDCISFIGLISKVKLNCISTELFSANNKPGSLLTMWQNYHKDTEP